MMESIENRLSGIQMELCHIARAAVTSEEQSPHLRDQFAMAALTGLLSGRSHVGIRMDWSKAAYEFADAMMKAREASNV